MKKLLRRLSSKLRDWHEKQGIRHVQAQQSKLEALPFFHSLYFGATGHTCPGWKSVDGLFHSDAPIAIVVTRGGKVSGVVGFEMLPRTMLVRQLQGAPFGNFNDKYPVAAYMLECAEDIAKALGVKVISVVTPDTAIAYRRDSPEIWQPSPDAEKHMRKIYGYPATTTRYLKSFNWRLRRPVFSRSLS